MPTLELTSGELKAAVRALKNYIGVVHCNPDIACLLEVKDSEQVYFKLKEVFEQSPAE
jgi:hypothetical protein